MKHFGRIFLTGLITILPILITLYILIWFSGVAESFFGQFIRVFIPNRFYRTGMGLIIGVALIFGVGLLMNAWIGQAMLAFSERLLGRIPVIKTLYGSARDVMNLFSRKGESAFSKVVIVTHPGSGLRQIGLLTSENLAGLPEQLAAAEDYVAVYLPMSYQMGGFTVFVPRSAIELTTMSFEDAMRFIITAGVSKKGAPRDQELPRIPSLWEVLRPRLRRFFGRKQE